MFTCLHYRQLCCTHTLPYSLSHDPTLTQSHPIHIHPYQLIPPRVRTPPPAPPQEPSHNSTTISIVIFYKSKSVKESLFSNDLSSTSPLTKQSLSLTQISSRLTACHAHHVITAYCNHQSPAQQAGRQVVRIEVGSTLH